MRPFQQLKLSRTLRPTDVILPQLPHSASCFSRQFGPLLGRNRKFECVALIKITLAEPKLRLAS